MKADNFKVALDVIKAVQRAAKDQDLAVPNPLHVLDRAQKVLENGPLPVEVVVFRVIEVWERDTANL